MESWLLRREEERIGRLAAESSAESAESRSENAEVRVAALEAELRRLCGE